MAMVPFATATKAIALDRKGDSFTLQYRDYPHLPKIVRPQKPCC
jgi:hypothetical protein